jgi:hypothetical protein
MGKTIPAYRMALESEIERGRGFRKALESGEDRVAFEVMMEMCRNNAMASGNACNSIILEPMVRSILLAHQEKLRELECKLYDLFWLKSSFRIKQIGAEE